MISFLPLEKNTSVVELTSPYGSRDGNGCEEVLHDVVVLVCFVLGFFFCPACAALVGFLFIGSLISAS